MLSRSLEEAVTEARVPRNPHTIPEVVKAWFWYEKNRNDENAKNVLKDLKKWYQGQTPMHQDKVKWAVEDESAESAKRFVRMVAGKK